MTEVQKKLDINVIFENELAQYLIDLAEVEDKTIQEVLVSLVKEELEENVALSQIADERLSEGEEEVEGDKDTWK